VERLEFERLVAVQLHEQRVGGLDERGDLPERRGGNEPVLADGDCLDDGDIGIDEPSVLDLVADRGGVSVAEGDLAGVGLLAGDPRGLVGKKRRST